MSIDATSQINSTSLENTLKLAAEIGSRLKGGEVIELISDLGGGKTVFVRGLAKGMGSTDQVTSPTFTISREYKAGNLELHHYDLYRLSGTGPGVVADELVESIENPDITVVIEWSGAVEDVLPKDRLKVEITKTGDNTRELKLTAGKDHRRLLKD